MCSRCCLQLSWSASKRYNLTASASHSHVHLQLARVAVSGPEEAAVGSPTEAPLTVSMRRARMSSIMRTPRGSALNVDDTDGGDGGESASRSIRWKDENASPGGQVADNQLANVLHFPRDPGNGSRALVRACAVLIRYLVHSSGA